VGHTALGVSLGSIVAKGEKVVREQLDPKAKYEQSSTTSADAQQDILLQAASIAIGQLVNARLGRERASLDELAYRFAGPEARKLIARLDEVQALTALSLAEGGSRAESAKHTLDSLEKLCDFYEEKLRYVDSVVAFTQPGDASLADLQAQRSALEADLASARNSEIVNAQLHLIGLHKLASETIWSGTRDEIARATRELKRSYPNARVEDEIALVRVVTKEATYELHEVQPAERSAPTKPPGADHELSNQVVGVAGATTNVDDDYVPPTLDHIKQLVESARDAASHLRLPGIRAIRETSKLARYYVQLDDGTWTSITVAVTRTDGTTYARLVPNTAREFSTDGITIRGEHVLQINERLAPSDAPRVVGHGFARLVSEHEQAVKGEYARGEGILSPDDQGRIGEVVVLAMAARNGDVRARSELVLLTQHMGLRDGSPSAQARRAAVIKKLGAMWEVVVTLDSAIRTPLSSQQLNEVVASLVAANSEHLRRLPLHDAPAPVTDRPGQRISREELHEYAVIAERLRAAVSARTLARYRAQSKGGVIPRVADVMIGAGASLGGRDPNKLLIDARGRWQADASDNIAQVGQQMKDLAAARFGDVRQVAGPGERVPLDYIKYIEDSVAAQGEVIDGYATPREERGRVVVDIEPLDRSGRLTVEIGGNVAMAPGFTMERVPGGPRRSTTVILHEVETQLRQLAPNDPAAKELLRKLQTIATTNDIELARVSDILAEASPEVVGKLDAWTLSALSDRKRYDAVVMDDLADGKRQIFFSKDANNNRLKEQVLKLDDVPRTWMSEGAGGNAASAAEIILNNTQHSKVVLLGKDKPAGLLENPQFKEMATRFGDESVRDELAQVGIHVDISGSDKRLHIQIDPSSLFVTPKLTQDANGEQKIQLRRTYKDGAGNVVEDDVRDSAGKSLHADMLIHALGSQGQMPPEIAALAMKARRADWKNVEAEDVLARPVYIQADFTHDRRYIGYSVHIRIGGRFRVFEVRGAAARFGFLPFEEFKLMPHGAHEVAAIQQATYDDSPDTSGGFDAGFSATADMTSKQHQARWERSVDDKDPGPPRILERKPKK
jgi:hypothetical protein